MNNNLNDFNIKDYKPLRDVVFEKLRNAILSGQLKPNERLMEIQLAEKLGVSRTPIREAIRKLELEGLVTMIPRKGAYVSKVSLEEIIDTFEVRVPLEALAMTLAIDNFTEEDIKDLEESQNNFIKACRDKDIESITKYDSEIHRKIHMLSKNNKLISIMESLNEVLSRFRMIYFYEFIHSESIIKQHEEIIEAIKNKNVKDSVNAMKKHLLGIEKDMGKFLKSYNMKID